MKIKICGNTDSGNLRMVLRYAPDMVGFIFYTPSPRNVAPNAEVFSVDTGDVLRIGVFVDNAVPQILSVVKSCRLDGVQLHGIYPPSTAVMLKSALPFLKVIQVVHAGKQADIEGSARVADGVDWVLFDTPGPLYGGHGRVFDWSLLDSYKNTKPFMIAGGVALDNVVLLPRYDHLYGVDINSAVEDRPGIKNELKISKIIEAIRGLE
jgi:phosphoribosylanthranilate isomerase